MKPTLTIRRYEKNGDSIFSDVTFTSKNYRATWQGIERLGYEIPLGTFNSSFTFSPKFNCQLYLIDVPNRQGIRIHAGNSYTDVTGCLIIGQHRWNNVIVNSKIALTHFHALSKGDNLIIQIYEETNRKTVVQIFRQVFRSIGKRIREIA